MQCVVASRSLLCLCEVGGGDTELGWELGLNKIGQNWRKLAQIGPNETWSSSCAVPGLGGGSGLQCALGTSIPDIMATQER